MQCCEPKILPVEGYDYTQTFQFVPCGKCYGCQCNSRAEIALRMREEMKDPYNCRAYFITLTYSDKHLPTCLPEPYRLRVLDYIRSFPVGDRRYDFSLLDKSHLRVFLHLLSDSFRVRHCHATFDNHCNIKCPEPNSLLRFYCSGEYGDISHRCHFHCIILFPRIINLFDVINLCHDCWFYGDFDVDVIDTIGAVNYVAKHEVKECLGCEFQQEVAPIFAVRSSYGGGIGRIMKNDEVMKNRFLDSLETRDKEGLYYETKSSGHVYKVAVPRFLKKSWHPDRYSDAELVASEKDGIKNLIQFCFDNLKKNFYLAPDTLKMIESVKFEFYNIKSMYDLYHSLDMKNYINLRVISDMLVKINQPLIYEDMHRREVYLNKHISRKLRQIASDSSLYRET